MTAEPAIAIEGLTFAYGNGPTVLDIPELIVPRGARVFLHGPSGTGKTTLLGLIAGILDLGPRGQGQIRVLGTDITKVGGRERDRLRGARIGYIFQMFNLIPYLDVLENIVLPCRVSRERASRLGGTSPDVAARELATRLGIGAALTRPVTELSVGQQQRVAAARALLGFPDLVIADEPTSALDSDHRAAFLDLLFEEAKAADATVLFVSHDHGLKPLFEHVLDLRSLNRAASGFAP